MKKNLTWLARLIFSAVCLFSGCATNNQQVALEKDLREQETVIRDLQQKVADSERLLKDQDAELKALRDRSSVVANSIQRDSDISTVSGLSQPNQQITAASFVNDVANHDAVETRIAWGSVRGIRIHRLMSGLSPDAAKDGNRTVNVVLQPFDQDEELVKVAGEISLSVSLTNSQGNPTNLANRHISLTESRTLWTRGLLSSGFHVPLEISDADVKNTSATSGQQLLITATLDLGEHRKYSTSELFAVAQ